MQAWENGRYDNDDDDSQAYRPTFRHFADSINFT